MGQYICHYCKNCENDYYGGTITNPVDCPYCIVYKKDDEIAKLREALAFYADSANWKSRIDEDGNTRLWDDSIAINDRGNVARGALEE